MATEEVPPAKLKQRLDPPAGGEGPLPRVPRHLGQKAGSHSGPPSPFQARPHGTDDAEGVRAKLTEKTQSTFTTEEDRAPHCATVHDVPERRGGAEHGGFRSVSLGGTAELVDAASSCPPESGSVAEGSATVRAAATPGAVAMDGAKQASSAQKEEDDEERSLGRGWGGSSVSDEDEEELKEKEQAEETPPADQVEEDEYF